MLRKTTETRYCNHCQKNTAHEITSGQHSSIERCLRCFRGRDVRDTGRRNGTRPQPKPTLTT